MPLACQAKITDTPTQISCLQCSINTICFPAGLDLDLRTELYNVLNHPPALERGEVLFRTGATMKGIYAIRSGAIKTYITDENGHEQVTGYYLPGELLGLGALHSGKHFQIAEALESTYLCQIPVEDLNRLSKDHPQIQEQLINLLSKQLHDHHKMVWHLGLKNATSRVAALLLNCSERCHDRGFSASEIKLNLSRQDISSHLGLAVETVCRIFGQLKRDKVIDFKGRQIDILNFDALNEYMGTKMVQKGKIPRI
ncbi:MAG: helix-turn-helix domain-containing protein [Gammaproteobacteria bacterium]|nr:helix-turn-helix domain-containing protein [Gammaproteobacteria bacterium]